MFVGQEDAIEFVRADPTVSEAENELASAQTAIDEQPAVVGCDQRAVACAAATEHPQTEHVR